MPRLRIALFLATILHAESGKLKIYFLQLPVGEETYELNDNTLKAHFEYSERSSKVTLDATLKLNPDLTPEHFDSHGRSYRPFTIDAPVTPAGQSGPFFIISGYPPLSA